MSETKDQFGRKESYLQEHFYIHFWSEDHKGFLNETSNTFIDKTGGKDPKKENILDANIENNGIFCS